MQPSTPATPPARHQVQPHGPPCPPLARPALPNPACTVRAAAMRMEADHPPRPKQAKPKPDLDQPSTLHRCGVCLCACPDVVQRCPSHPASALPLGLASERHSALQPSPASQPSIACRNHRQASRRPVTPLLLENTATRQQYIRSTLLPVVAPHGIHPLPRPRTVCELGTPYLAGIAIVPHPNPSCPAHESRTRSTQRHDVATSPVLCPHSTYIPYQSYSHRRPDQCRMPPTRLLLADAVQTRPRPTLDPLFDDRRMQDIKE